MRIIGGTIGGQRFMAPAGLPVRPTTDQAKEALFNILENRYELASMVVLDLFSGTGSVGIEFASRGALNTTMVDAHPGCCRWLNTIVGEKLPGAAVKIVKSDAFKYLQKGTGTHNIIFADPPYEMKGLETLHGLAYNVALAAGGTLILEHNSRIRFDSLEGFTQRRTYGNSTFSFFEKP